ncbi:MAG: di-heme-cytochrome C peroxidase [Pseudomonadota bacterium]
MSVPEVGMPSRTVVAAAVLAAATALAGCRVESALEIDPATVPKSTRSDGQLSALRPAEGTAPAFINGWNKSEERAFEHLSQGSRLMPLTWFKALEKAGSTSLFSSPGTMAAYGYLPSSTGSALPAGFAVDKQADEKFTATKLRWYAGQEGKTASTAEPWFGMTCGACHISEVRFGDNRTRLYGGASLADFQSLVEDLDASVVATKGDPEKWERFAARVLAGKDTPANRALLSEAFDQHLNWQMQAKRTNATSVRYGHGRVDALGRLYNKMTQFAGAGAFSGNPPSAPVSYPFLWDVYKNKYVQWNGSARNTSVWKRNASAPDLGAYGRNAGQAIGVFGEVVVSKNGDRATYKSSLQSKNIIRLERMISKLNVPKWPAYLPPINAERAVRGQRIYAKNCQRCHTPETAQKKGKPTDRMILFADTRPEDQTDIHMACNAYTYNVASGRLQGTPNPLTGRPFLSSEPGSTMLHVMVSGVAKENFGDIAASAPARLLDRFSSGTNFAAAKRRPVSRAQARQVCMNTKNPVLGYKARPLDGIWATAPYLHNGSVPTLYDLLLPAAQRPKSFYVGSRELDPVNVGFSTKAGGGNSFLFRVGPPGSGNNNAGHDYGTSSLSEDQRLDLLEYLKSL